MQIADRAQMPHAFRMRAGQSAAETPSRRPWPACPRESARSTAILLTLPPCSFEYFPSTPPSPWEARARAPFRAARPARAPASPPSSPGLLQRCGMHAVGVLKTAPLWHACSRCAQDGDVVACMQSVCSRRRALRARRQRSRCPQSTSSAHPTRWKSLRNPR